MKFENLTHLEIQTLLPLPKRVAYRPVCCDRLMRLRPTRGYYCTICASAKTK